MCSHVRSQRILAQLDIYGYHDRHNMRVDFLPAADRLSHAALPIRRCALGSNSMPPIRDYDTRLDRYRRATGLPLDRWAKEARMNRTQLAKYRAAVQEPTATAVANLVRAARKLSGGPVRASDLFDLGESEPVSTSPDLLTPPRMIVRKLYDTRFEHCLVRESVPPTVLARAAAVTRHTLLNLRRGAQSPSVSMIERLVRAMRRMGRNVSAADLFDVGDDSSDQKPKRPPSRE
jgi:hypothetical protein